jgi:hypothetical protein
VVPAAGPVLLIGATWARDRVLGAALVEVARDRGSLLLSILQISSSASRERWLNPAADPGLAPGWRSIRHLHHLSVLLFTVRGSALFAAIHADRGRKRRSSAPAGSNQPRTLKTSRKRACAWVVPAIHFRPC